MPHVRLTLDAIADLRRCAQFLASKNPRAAERASQTILDQIGLLASSPEIGRPVLDTALRELLIPFGDAGYAALYEYHPAEDTVIVAAIRHQKEAGY